MSKDKKILKYGLGLSWLTCWFLIIPISLIAIMATTYKLVKRKSKLTKYAVLMSPFFILPLLNIGTAIIHYSNGQGKIRTYGYPSPEFANINPKYRVNHKSMGCSITGTEHLTSKRYNQTLKFLIKQFGYQKNSFTGIIPNIEDVHNILKSNMKKNHNIGAAILNDDRELVLSNNLNNYKIDLNNQHGLFRKTIKENELIIDPKLKLIDECLLVQLNEEWAYLVELRNKEIITQYRL